MKCDKLAASRDDFHEGVRLGGLGFEGLFDEEEAAEGEGEEGDAEEGAVPEPGEGDDGGGADGTEEEGDEAGAGADDAASEGEDIGEDFEGFEDEGCADEHDDESDETEEPGDEGVLRLGGGEHGFFGLHAAGDAGDAGALTGGVFLEGICLLPSEQAGVAGFEGFELHAGVAEGGVLRGLAEDEPLVLDGGEFGPRGGEGGEVGQGVRRQAGPLREEEVGQAESAEGDFLGLELGGLEEGFGVFVILGVTELGGVVQAGVPFFDVVVFGDFFFAATDFGFGGLFGFLDPLEDFDVAVELDEVGAGDVELVVFGRICEGGGAG